MALVILPDTAIHEHTLSRLQDTAGPVLCQHRSGRPWILGGPTDGGFIASHNRHINVVVTGHTNIDEGELAKRLDGIDSLTRTENLAEELVEFDVLLLAHDGSQFRAYAPTFQSRSLFWTRFNGLAIVSDEQYPLAALNNFELDHGVLTTRIVNAEVSHPFIRRPVWHNVDALGIGEFLTVADGADPQRKKWWTPPQADRSISELGHELSSGIEEALRFRTQGSSVVSADLSGGLDSTTLSFFAAELGLDLHTFFIQARSKSNNDWKWSDRAVEEIASNHLKIPYQSVLDHITDEIPASLSMFPEGPGSLSSAIASAASIEQHISGSGSTLHLNGHAGDALFGQVSSMIWSYFRSGGHGRYTWLWRYRTMNRIPVSAMLRMLWDRRTFTHELDQIALGNYSYPAHDAADYSSWIQTPRFPDIFTGVAKEQVSDLARTELKDGATALSADRTVHQILSYLTAHGAVNRRMNYVADKVRFDSPYLDRRVVEPAISLNHRERTRQYPAKPLLAAARPKTMSLDYFMRQDKGDYTPEVFDHHRTILKRARNTFSEGSILGELGLVHDDEVARVSDSYSADGAAYSDLVDLEFAERWLRNVHDEKARLATREHHA
ncbi:asparagine synthase-related protein [Nocardiopsis synnemataformans]|uniref:asparagine synthase-related protein n=1 Tax=Nocardiopsis synnemataformans TaxID=61305 RepID=UPI003EB776EE